MEYLMSVSVVATVSDLDRCRPFGLESLFEEFDARDEPLPLSFIEEKLRLLDLQPNQYQQYVSFRADIYNRVSIRRTPHYEALILSWASGQLSPIHNHRGSACAIRLLEGAATEITFQQSPCGKLFPAHTGHYSAGAVWGSYDTDVHQIANLQGANEPMVSLHVYSPPLTESDLFPLTHSTFADYDRLLLSSMRRTTTLPA